MKNKKRNAALDKLTQFTRETGYMIGGCGCCGSPWLRKVKNLEGFYVGDGDSSHCDDIDWKGKSEYAKESDSFHPIEVDEEPYENVLLQELDDYAETLLQLVENDVNLHNIASEMKAAIEILKTYKSV